MLKESDIKMKQKKNIIIITILSILLVILIVFAIISYNEYSKDKKEIITTSEIEKEVNKKYKDDGFEYKLKSQNKNNVAFEKIDKSTKEVILECKYNINNKKFNCYTLPVTTPSG